MRLGIDIGGTKTAAVVLGPDDVVVASSSAPSGRGPADVVARAAEVARLVVAEAGGRSAVVAAGACIPGLVDPASGTVRHAVNLGIDELDLAAALSAALDLRVAVENDVKAAALGAHLLSGPGVDGTFAYLNLGTGLAAAVVHGGAVIRGVDGAAGEIGHLPAGGGAVCACGQTGCLETLASGTALLRLWPAAPDRGWDVFGASASGDADAAAAAESLCRGLATAVMVLVLASGAERVVVGGGLAALGGPLLDGVRAELRSRAEVSPFLASLGLPGRLSLLDPDVPLAAIGAARLAGAR